MDTSHIPSLKTPQQDKQQGAEPSKVQINRTPPEQTQSQQQKAALNTSLLKSTQVSIGAKDQSLSLLLNTAIERINESLAPELGENAIQKAADSGLDISPEATAERIVSLSTAFYSAFKEQNAASSETESLENFISTIGSGIDKGFEEARDILDGLKALEETVATNIDETYNLVQEKLNAFQTMITETLSSSI